MEKILFVFEVNSTLIDCGKSEDGQFKFMESIKRGSDRLFPYPEIKDILDQIIKAGYKIAFTSTTSIPACIEQALQFIGLRRFAHYLEFSTDSKEEQFNKLIEKSGVPANNVIFFDSVKENIDMLKNSQVKTFLIPDEGLTRDTFIVAIRNASFSIDLDELGITWGHSH